MFKHVVYSTPVSLLESALLVSLFAERASVHSLSGWVAITHVTITVVRDAMQVRDYAKDEAKKARERRASCRCLRDRLAHLLSQDI